MTLMLRGSLVVATNRNIHQATPSSMSKVPAAGSLNTPRVSQDVFLEPDQDGRIHMAESSHAGNHFFRSIAELNRTKFTSSQQDAKDRVALSIVHSIWNKGRGKLYVRNLETNEWTEVRAIGEAKGLVYRALETLFSDEEAKELSAIEAAAQEDASSEEDSPPREVVVQVEEPGPTEQSGPSERRHSASTLEAASSLLLVQESAASYEEDPPEQQAQEEAAASAASAQHEPTTEQQVKFQNINIDMAASFDSPTSSPNSDNEAKAAVGSAKKPEKRRRSACHTSDFVSDQQGIAFSNVRPNDVLCGGSGEGVLAIRHEGNRRFLKVIEAEMEDFHKSDDKGKLRIAQQAVEHAVPGRFLAYNPDSGLWHELKRDKAWFKSLRTFLKRQQRQEPEAQPDAKRRALPRPNRRMT